MTIGWLNACSVRNKADVTITDRSLDVLALQETWHTASDVPATHDTDRLRRRRCGAYHQCGRRRCTSPQEEHEVLVYPDAGMSNVRVSLCASATGPIVILNVYRPGSEKRPSPLFYDELSTVLATLVDYACPDLSSSAEISTCTSRTQMILMLAYSLIS